MRTLVQYSTLPFMVLVIALAGCNAKKEVAKATPDATKPGVTTESKPVETHTKAETPTNNDPMAARDRGRPTSERQPAASSGSPIARRDAARPPVKKEDNRVANRPEADRGGAPDADTVKPDEEERETPEREQVARGKTPNVGDEIRPISGKDVDGIEFSLSEYQGKVMMLDFWGDW